MDASLLIDDSAPGGTVLFVSPRKYTEVVAIRSSRHGITGTVERIPESDEEWGLRCVAILNVGVM